MKTKILSPLRRDGIKAGMTIIVIALSAMLFTTACSNDDNAINNAPNPKGYALPVTLNVTRQGDNATTRAEYDKNGDKKLTFSAGDQLLVYGSQNGGAGDFAGTLTWQSGGTFSGTIYTQNQYTGTALQLVKSTSGAQLLPSGYDTHYYYLRIKDEGTYSASLIYDKSKAFALTKAAAVEQFSDEDASGYDDTKGFQLAPKNAILNFNITGLTANTNYVASLSVKESSSATTSTDISGSVTADASGAATFAIGLEFGTYYDCKLTVSNKEIVLGNYGGTVGALNLTAGKIYNINREWTSFN